LSKRDVEKFQSNLLFNFQIITETDLSTHEKINTGKKKKTSIQKSIDNQKKTVNHTSGKIKPWWDSTILNPISSKRNQARRWMLLAKSTASFECYQYWQNQFKKAIVQCPAINFHESEKKHSSLREAVKGKQKIGADKQSACANDNGHRNEK
jgi:superfamily I DNA/RNA helicase